MKNYGIVCCLVLFSTGLIASGDNTGVQMLLQVAQIFETPSVKRTKRTRVQAAQEYDANKLHKLGII